MSEIKVTPCCKTRHWHTILAPHFITDTIRCEICEKAWNREQLETIVKGLNPITFFCEKCHANAEDVKNQLSVDE